MLYMRFQPVVIGTATVLLVFLLAKQMYGQRAAIISSLFLCFLPWHIIHSRIMGRVIWVPFFGCLIFLSLIKAIQEKKRLWAGLWFLLSCFFLRESIRYYETAVVFIPIFFAALVCVRKEADWRKNMKMVFVAALISLVFLSPFIRSVVAEGIQSWGAPAFIVFITKMSLPALCFLIF